MGFFIKIYTGKVRLVSKNDSELAKLCSILGNCTLKVTFDVYPETFLDLYCLDIQCTESAMTGSWQSRVVLWVIVP